jgi:hypothetical protein
MLVTPVGHSHELLPVNVKATVMGSTALMEKLENNS